MNKTIQAKQRKKVTKVAEPHVGILWLVDGKLLIDSTALGKAEVYGEFKIHSGNHISVWEKFQQNGTAPSEMEYEEAPRGRVMYNTRTRRFTFLADKCILRDKSVVRKIMSEINLPVNTQADTQTDTDSHYRCFRCLRGR
jgi:hypothetical protein